MWGHVKYEIYDFASGNSESKKKKKKEPLPWKQRFN